jgi:BirA family biotin operon repressor/biotin-[acetyl-CoA-carboxylase] ligase
MAFALGPKALAAGYRLAAYDTIGSTNREALEQAQQRDVGRLWVVATAQTEGRGRRGRVWQTPPGNLAASILLTLPGEQTKPATLGFAAGLALESAIRTASPRIGCLRLKWPNDVLIDGAKVAGILLEAMAGAGGPTNVAIGFGVNVLHHPDRLSYSATSLAACGVDVTAFTLFEALAEAWVDEEDRWNAGRGFEAIRERWLQRAAGLGAPIAVRTGEALYDGTFETIDDDGRLVVRAPDGKAYRVSAGEVHLGNAATART